MAVTNDEAQRLVQTVYERIDREEWDSDTIADVGEIFEAFGFVIHEPRPGRDYWSQYAAEYVREQVRLAVWNVDGYTFGIQVWDSRRSHNDPNQFITMHVDKHELTELDDYLDKAIEIFEGMQHE